MRYNYDSRTTFTRSSSVSLVPPRNHHAVHRRPEPQGDTQSSTLHRQFSKLTPIYSSVPRHHTKVPARSVQKNLEFIKRVDQPKKHHVINQKPKAPDISTLAFVEANLYDIDLDITDGVVDTHSSESLAVGSNGADLKKDLLRQYFEPEASNRLQILEPTVPVKKKRLKYVGRFLVLALLASVVGLWGYLLSDSFFITKQASATTQQTSIGSESGALASNAFMDEAAYNPKTLTISKLNIHATIDSIGTTPTGAMDVPLDIWKAGWYTGSAKPGQPGAVFMDGHASSSRGALFGNLDTLVAGDQIEIERNDGIVIKYSVLKTNVVNRKDVDMSEALKPYDDYKKGLTIMSCVGAWVAAESTLENRVLVYAVQD